MNTCRIHFSVAVLIAALAAGGCNGGGTTVSSSTSPPPGNDSSAPTVPTNLMASAVSSSQINLNWAASTDNVGVAGYRVYRGGSQVATTGATSYSDSALSASTAYSYKVSAYDAAGNVSAQSSAASATTQAPPSGTGPTIQLLTGTFNHKGTVTISGTGFGAKNMAAPVIWDDASGTSLAAIWSGWWPNAGTAAYQMTYSTPIRGVSPPHSHITKYLTGAHGDSTGSNSGWNVALWKDVTKSEGETLYWSWYHRADPAWVFGLGSPNDANYKTFGYSLQGSIYELPNNWYAAYQPDNFTSTTATMCLAINDDSGTTFQSPDSNGHNAFWWDCVAGANPASDWVKSEIETKISSTNGYIKQWENGTLVIDYAGPTDKYSGSARSVGIGGYYRGYGDANNRRYFGDIYFDTTAARIILGNTSTLSTSTIREVQIPTAWSTTSITFSVNLGKFTTGQTAYLFVIDPAGASNATGFAVTIN